MAARELPLLPLNAVLFPQMILPLHIFEPRYVQMIEESLASDHRFGVVLIREGEEVGEAAVPFDVGTVAHIKEFRELEDKRYMIVAVGEIRFRLESVRQEGERLFAGIHYLNDEPQSLDSLRGEFDAVSELASEHLHLVQRALGREAEDHPLPTDPQVLSFLLSANLQTSLEERQTLLELTDTRERLRRLQDLLAAEIATLSERLEIHEEAERTRGSNGRLPHNHITPEALDSLND